MSAVPSPAELSAISPVCAAIFAEWPDAEIVRIIEDAPPVPLGADDDPAPIAYPDPVPPRVFPVTFFQTYGAMNKGEARYTLPELADRIRSETASSKDDLPWLKLARFGNKRTAAKSLRHDANVLAVTGIEADYDDGEVTIDEALEILAKQGVASILYTSPSHTEDAPRWRVLCPQRRHPIDVGTSLAGSMAYSTAYSPTKAGPSRRPITTALSRITPHTRSK